MSEKHELIDVVLVELTALELEDADPQEIKRVQCKQHEGTEDSVKEKPQPWTDCAALFGSIPSHRYRLILLSASVKSPSAVKIARHQEKDGLDAARNLRSRT